MESLPCVTVMHYPRLPPALKSGRCSLRARIVGIRMAPIYNSLWAAAGSFGLL